MADILLDVKNLKQHFKINRKFSVKAVDGISFSIEKGKTLGLVGESGSGKSTTGRSIIRLYTPTDGEVLFQGKNISGKLDKESKQFVRSKIQMIFQDPMSCLNPRKTVLDIVAEGLDNYNQKISAEERQQRVIEVLEKVGMNSTFINRYPHQFSGGQRQRIGIARALIMKPELIIADEAISALDVSIQAQVVNLLKEIQKETGVTLLFIAHDLSMVKYISDTIAVMHLGHIVEYGSKSEIFNNPLHPYTHSLISAIPLPDPLAERKRKSKVYLYSQSGIDYNQGEMIDFNEQHKVLATEAEYQLFCEAKYDNYLI